MLAYPRGTQTENTSSVDQDNVFVKLVKRISLSPEPLQKPMNIFSNIRTPTYFTSAISASLMMGTPGNLEPPGEDVWNIHIHHNHHHHRPSPSVTARHQIGRLVNNEINRLVNVAS